MIDYRIIPTEEAVKLAHVFYKSYVPEQSEEAVRKWFDRPPDDRTIFAAMDGDILAASLMVVTGYDNRIRGSRLRFGGVAGVATLPEYRRERLVRGLFKQAFAMMNEKDVVFSALAPFSFQFYEKFGYAHAAQMNVYEFPPELLRRMKVPADVKIREAQEADREAMMNVQRSMARFGSRVFLPPEDLLDNGAHEYCLTRAGQVAGVLRLHFSSGGEEHSTMRVNHAWFASDDILPAIVDMVHRYGSQCEKIVWSIDPEVPLEYYLTEMGRAKRSRSGYMMTRVVKFAEFCRQIKVPLFAAEPVVVSIEDDHCPWNNGVFQLTPVSGRLEIAPTDKEPELHLDPLHLTHAVSGLLTANRLHRLGGLPCAAAAAERFTRIFPPESYVTYVDF